MKPRNGDVGWGPCGMESYRASGAFGVEVTQAKPLQPTVASASRA